MPLNLPRVPDEPLVDDDRRIRDNWLRWIVNIFTRVYSFGVSQASLVALEDQGASIGPTPLALGQQITGRYRLGLYGKVTEPAGATSSLQLHVFWTDPTDGAAMQYDSPTISGNVATEAIQVYVPVDARAVSYGATYASTGVPDMKFKATISAEALPG